MLAKTFLKPFKNVKLQEKSPEAIQNETQNPEKQASANYL